MKNKLVARARQVARQAETKAHLPVPSGTAKPVSAERAASGSVDDLLARARAIGNAASAGQAIGRPAPSLSAHKLRLPVTCSATGGAFIALVELSGSTARIVGNEALKGAGGVGGAGRDLGSYAFEAPAEWRCPLCGSRNHADGVDLLWWCDCRGGDFHCVGSDRAGLRYCACGRREIRNLVPVEHVPVRGERAATAVGRAQAASSALALPPAAQPRLPSRRR